MTGFTAHQLNAIRIIVCTGSVISLLGSVFIIVTFTCSSAFRNKPISRLVFYASFGNMMSSIGNLMFSPNLTQLDSFRCQFQALLTQWFGFADASWTLAMAINIYLTIYRKFDARRLRQMEIVYLLACYGIPFIPALTYLFVRRNGQRVYGYAVMWCWISADFDILRMTTFYDFVWLYIILTLSIYIRTGHTIFEIRRQVRRFHSPDRHLLFDIGDEERTEVRVTTEATGDTHFGTTPRPGYYGGDYSVLASSPCTEVTLPVNCHTAYSYEQGITGYPPLRSQTSTINMAARPRSYEFQSAAWSYTKYALLYFTAIFISWIPPSANRVYTITHGGAISTPLVFIHAVVGPLKGFWNFVIYTAMSWVACKALFQSLKGRVLTILKAEF